MTSEELFESLGDIREDHIACGRRLPVHRRQWAVLAACICLILLIPFALLQPGRDSVETADLPANLTLNGTRYFISPYLAVSAECPEGFVYGDETTVDGVGECAYYVSEDCPEWVYVRQEVNTDGKVDETGTLIRTEPHEVYVRYVDERIRGKKFVSFDGALYISLWDYADARALSTYGRRTETLPDEFSLIGTAEFTGYDTVPTGVLGCNTGSPEIYAGEDEQVLLVSTEWHTATAEENGETLHTGWNVYVRCADDAENFLAE